MNNCLVTTEEIRYLTKELQDETEESVKGLVALWQKENNKSIEEYPTVRELNNFRFKLRSANTVEMLDEALSPSFDAPKVSSIEEQAKVDLDFDPRTRRDRVSLIARFFSNEVDKALQEMNDSLNKRMDTASDEERLQLQMELSSLNRFDAIKKYTPAGLFDRVLDIFQSYINDTEENRVQIELGAINAREQTLIDEGVIDESERFSDEQKLDAARRKAVYKEQAYRKVVDNFKPLAEEASTLLITTEGVRIDLNYIAPKDANLNDDTPEGYSELDEQADDYNKEETFKDGWMTNFRQVSSHESLSQAVRKVIREIPRLDYEGMYEEDDLGNLRYLDADYVHATLIDKLRDMITSEDMIPLIQELERNKPWVAQVRELLEKDDTLFSQFYQDFRKDFIPYWIQKKKTMLDGTFKMQTIAINKPEGVYYLLDAWRDNYENGMQLDNDSVYEKNGDINIENAEKGLKWVETLNNKFSNLDTEARLELLEDDRIWKTILKLLNMIGIDANPSILRNALTDIRTSDTAKFTDPIMVLLPQLNIIFKGIKKGEIKSETGEDGIEKRGDLINTFGSAYSAIANMMANVTEDAIESSVRENDKSYYSHVTPNYLGKLIKQLKNVRGDRKRFEEFINTEFKQYEWFFKDGRWRSDWLEQLVNSEEMRRGLNHKVVLNSDKVDYTNWDDLDYTLALLTEYWGDPEDSRTSVKWAWYHVPILSDSPSAEFIRFRKYVSGVEYDENGNKLTYDDIILDKLTDLVNQEYDRIMLVRARDEELQNGNPNISPIANYDIVRKKDGSIKGMGGAEFKFLPALNSIRYDNGETFFDRLSRLSREGSGAELKDFIRGALREVMDNGFEEAYRDWARIGLLGELPNGRYKYLPFAGQTQQNSRTAKSLIKAKEILGTTLWTTDMELLLKDYNNNNPVDDRVAANLFQQIRDMVTQRVTRGDITKQEADSINRNLVVKNNAKAALREYYWNSKLATSQIIELTTTDLAFYKNVEDFQKRYKEVHAPALRMNTKATYKGEKIGRDWERTIYLKDDEITSSVLSDIETVIMEKYKKGELSDYNAASILSKFGYSNHTVKSKDGQEKKYAKVGNTMVETSYVNVADAQAYRSLSSYRTILGMSGQWTDEMEQAYNNFKNGTWNIADFNIIWQTKKPYVYTQVNNMSGVQGHTGIKTPVQHKNSEFLLLAMHELIAGPLGKSSKLRAINEFMEEDNIDVVQFESTTKVGKQGIIDLNQVSDFKQVKEVLKNATTQDGVENPNVVHKVSYEDYGIQTATPEHAIDAVQLVGTQIRKLITADIAPDAIIEVDGKKMTKQEWLDLYNAVNTENILQAFRDVDDIFKDPKKVEEILLEEIRGNQRYGIDMMRACTLNENGQFNIPLFDPVQSQRVQTLLNSIIKSRITKQKIRGGALIQVSDYGLTDELHVVFEGEGENKRIKYLECYMPAYSREFYEPLMKEGTHELDINKLPEDLRKLIGYRVPTEDKYSMAPLYIKGFLPQQNGSAIMLPAEITTLSGSDFDVDKMYIMLPEFKVEKFDFRRAKQDFKGEQRILDELASLFREGSLMDDFANAPVEFKEWFKENKEKYRLATPKIRKVKYDFNKAPQENSLEARNNLMIDMMWGVLTNADTASKILNPGGSDYQKKAARIVSILSSSYESDLRRDLNIPNGSVITKLLSMDLEELDKLAERTKRKLDPISPRTQVQLHQQNMTGAKLIGIYANHNANHALMQHTELGLDVENGSFVLNGKRLTSLHDIMNRDKEFISKNNAGFLAASVDNVKDPVLAGINQNTFTADASMLLSRLGYNPVEIGLLMAQPIIMDITQAYFRESREGKGKDTVIDEILVEYKKKAAMMEEVTYDNYKNNDFLIEDLANNILIAKEMAGITSAHQTSDYSKVEFYKKQVAVGFLFKRIMRTADSLGQLVQATRSDTQGGAAGPTIADTKLKIQKVQDFLKDMEENDKFPLVGADVISDSISLNDDIDNIREQLLASKLPFLQAFYTLGLKQSERMLSKYFPQFTESFDEVVDVLRNMTKTGRLNVKTMNSIYNDLLAYIMSKTDFFGAEPDWSSVDENGNPTKMITSADKRRDFINNFPTYFKKVVAENEDIADLEFIKRLRVIRANDTNPVDTVVFKNVGQLSPTLRERYMRDWTSLLYMSNPEAQKLALNLFRYSFYRNGFAFGPSTFIHLAPVAVRNAVPEYIETLRSLLTSEDDYSNFVEQYIYNHLDNRKLVPEVPDDTSTSFIGEDNEIKDEVTFVIDENANFGDKKIIRKRIDTPDGPVYDFFDFIARRNKGGYIYYRLTTDRVDESNVAVYRRIEPLGFRNSFIEYEYRKEASEVTSAIEKNKKDYNSNATIDETFASYDTPQMTEEDLANYDIYRESFSEDTLNQAYESVYGTPLEIPQGPENDVTSIQPNVEYKDENGDSICGATNLLS
ncbi:putative RNA polymerase [uncultured phage cr128_1]|uniref:Putative RNA polymerase n=2 Tax=root TaxID=1 RepID=A0A7M1S1I4_9CAUD|nr:putative RNA polymerase [uncultured phage cr128_1]QOR59699.1 putative RNA polymerase [uncultured phage cr128_1]